MLVEKRVAGIIRWLERLKKSYSSGALESALMDAECARADLENLRLAVWEKVKPEKISRPKISARVISVIKPLILACVIVMVYVFPISKEAGPQVINIAENEPELALNVQEAERPQKISIVAKTVAKTLPEVQTVQRRAAQKNSEPETQQAQKKTAAKKTSDYTKTSAKRPAMTKQPVKEGVSHAPVANNNNKAVAYDKVFSLIQTGQRALKNDNSVVKVK